jgi:hypothetical protein
MNDTVTNAASISGYLAGGSGNDVLRGGSGRDWIYGDAGDDVLDGAGSNDDLSGGDGTDRVDYSARSAAVDVTLDGAANDGEANEHDNVSTSVESVTGGAGGDTLTGDSAANVLRGGPGADTIDGGLGADVLEGGDGPDSLLAKDGVVDQIACGAGADTISADATDSVDADCARDSGPGAGNPMPGTGAVLDLPSSLRLTPMGSIHVRIRCARAGRTCRGRIEVNLLRGTASVASARAKKGRRFKVKAGRSKIVTVHISRNGRRRVLAKRKAKCRVSMVAGGHVTSSKVVTVKAPKSRRK